MPVYKYCYYYCIVNVRTIIYLKRVNESRVFSQKEDDKISNFLLSIEKTIEEN